MKDLYKYIINTLKPEEFSHIISGVLSREEKEKIIKELEIEPLDEDLEELSEDELDSLIVDIFGEDPQAGNLIISRLTEACKKEIEEFEEMSINKEIEDLLLEAGSYERLMCRLWAALVIGRKDFVRHAITFLKEVDSLLYEVVHRIMRKNKVNVKGTEIIINNKELKKALKELLKEATVENQMEKRIEKTIKENIKLKANIESLKERVKLLQSEIGKHTAEKGELKKQIKEMENKIAHYEKVLETGGSGGAKSERGVDIEKIKKKYEKEIKKIKHEIEVMKNDYNKKLEEIEKLKAENRELKEKIEKLESENEALFNEKEILRKKYERVSKEIEEKKKEKEQHPQIEIPPEKRLGIFIDDESIFLTIKNIFGGKKLDYEKFINYVSSEDRKVVRAIQYMRPARSDKAMHYLNFLKIMGIEIRTIPLAFINNRSEYIIKDIETEVNTHNIKTIAIVSMNIDLLKKVKENFTGKDYKIEVYGISDVAGFNELNAFYPITEDLLK